MQLQFSTHSSAKLEVLSPPLSSRLASFRRYLSLQPMVSRSATNSLPFTSGLGTRRDTKLSSRVLIARYRASFVPGFMSFLQHTWTRASMAFGVDDSTWLAPRSYSAPWTRFRAAFVLYYAMFHIVTGFCKLQYSPHFHHVVVHSGRSVFLRSRICCSFISSTGRTSKHRICCQA